MKRQSWIKGEKAERGTQEEPPVGSIWKKKRESFGFKYFARVDERRLRTNYDNTCVSLAPFPKNKNNEYCLKRVKVWTPLNGGKRTINTKVFMRNWVKVG